ncbi:MAG: ABC transporter permease [bacterium]|nr:ABC transporter permease [bacterium]
MNLFPIADLRFAVRAIVRRPGVTVIILLTMAVGIGAATAIFSVVESVLLRPLPYPEVERLVIPRTQEMGESFTYQTTYTDLLQWKEAEVFENVAVFGRFGVDLTGDGGPTRASALTVGEGYFDVVRLGAVQGRVFAEDEHLLEGPPVAVIGERFWNSRFGRDPQAVGKLLRIDGEDYSIIGIAHAHVASPTAVDVILPFRPDMSDESFTSWDNHAYTAVARLKSGETLRSTSEHLAMLAAQTEAEHPDLRAGETIVALTLNQYITGRSVRQPLRLLMAAVLFVLLMGCINIANLLLSVASKRQREFAVRSALGANGWRIFRLLIVESLVLAPIGAVLGVGVAMTMLRVFVGMAPPGIPRVADVELNFAVLAFSLVLSLVAALAFGAAPGVRAAATGAGSVGTTRTTTGKRERRGRNILVGLQLALSLALLAGAGYTIVSFQNLQDSDLGFEIERIVNVPLDLPRARYQPGEAVINFYEDLTQQIASLPGVQSATIRSALTLNGGGFYMFRSYLAEGRPEPPEGVETSGPWTVVGPGYLATQGMTLLQGRGFLATDTSESEQVVIVNREFADQVFPGQDPIGKRIRSWRDENVYRRIVGIVGNVRYFSAGDEIRPCVYVPHKQCAWRAMNLIVRTQEEPAATLPSIRTTIAKMDSDLVVADTSTMADLVERDLAGPRFLSALVTAFAGLALLQAGLGIYGVLSYLVSLRTREIGVRMAVGARGRDVLWLVVGETLKVVAISMLIGLGGVVVVGKLLGGVLFEVSTVEPSVVLAISFVLAVVATVASAIPAARAASVSPATALRRE